MTKMPDCIWANTVVVADGEPLAGEWNYRDVGSADDTPYIRADLVPTWQPIETAPKDLTVFLAYLGNNGPGRVEMLRWVPEVEEFYDCAGEVWHPTHWMPLPEAPKKG